MLYLVLGTPRSGTSLTAGILHNLGVSMGTDLMEGNEWNPEGFFMDFGAFYAFDRFFERCFPDTVWKDDLSKAREGLKSYLESRKANKWGIKEHRGNLLFNEIKAACQDEISLVFTSRDSDVSAQSWSARHGADYETSKKHILFHGDSIQKTKQSWTGPQITLEYDLVISSPQKEVERLANFVALPVTQAALDLVKPEHKRF